MPTPRFTPRPYQRLLIDHIIETPRCAGFVFMGGGKTAATLAAINTLSLLEDVFPVLIVAPLRVARKTWREETQKWADFEHLIVSQIIGNAVERTTAIKRQADIYTINFENLPWLLERVPKNMFRVIVIDEASSLKNFRGSVQHHHKTGKPFLRCDSGKRAKALAHFAYHCQRIILLTGTPAARSIENLWAQLWFIDFGERLHRTFEQFSLRWFRPHPSGFGQEPTSVAQQEIQKRISDVCLTVEAKDWFDLREPIRTVIPVDLPPDAMKAYRAMEQNLFLEIDGNAVEAMNAASKTQKCLQLSNGAIYTDEDRNWSWTHDEKIVALKSIVEEANGMPVLVAYQWQSDLQRLLEAFPEGRLLKTAQDEDDFKAGKIPVLFAHPQSAGHGIDGFQKVTNIIAFFGHWWDLETRLQIIERIGPVRQLQSGMDRPVFIYDIVATGTIDELVMERHATKKSVQELLLEALAKRNNRKGV